MVRIRTERTRIAMNDSFGVIIKAFKDFKTKRIIRMLERKNKKFENNDFVLFNQTCLE